MEKLIIIKTLSEMEQLSAYLADKDFVAYDTETTGLDKDAKIIGISVSADTDVGYYVILSYWDKDKKELVELETQQGIKPLIQNLTQKQLVMHNGLFDTIMTERNFGIDLMPALHTDTMLLAHLLDENRLNGLKELGVTFFGASAKDEQEAMKASIEANGGSSKKNNYELYKADADLIANYGAKDAILTIKLFYLLAEQLYEEGLDKFFYEEETMPLLKTATKDLNQVGLKVDVQKLNALKAELIANCEELKASIYSDIQPYVKHVYPGTSAKNTFKLGSPAQMAWLLFDQLGELFVLLTEEGRELCHSLNMKLPYSNKAKIEFMNTVKQMKGKMYHPNKINPRTRKRVDPKKIRDYWVYLKADKDILTKFSHKYKWAANYLKYSKETKLLTTYAESIGEKLKYGIIYPEFKQSGTTSGRYSSRNPNFQNLPRDDKRVKACIVSRPGKLFVGADYSQLEPRVFASVSQDEKLMACFSSDQDFYSVIGAEVFDKGDCDLRKDVPNAFASKYKELRQVAKVIALSATYGTTAPKMSGAIGKSMDEAQEILDNYFERFPKVREMMLNSHNEAKANGKVYSLYGRPRRLPLALKLSHMYKNTPHEKLPYEARSVLNLSVNHRIQSTAASIVNRASIMFYDCIKELNLKECHIVMQVHDEIIVECKEEDAENVASILRMCMENAVELPGVALIAEPKIANNLGDLK
jgi:DNA polymerase-1